MKTDLTNPELDELDHLLARTPEALRPMDVVALDGYLCGVIVQPELIAPEQWLPLVFDLEAHPLPPDADPAWWARTRALVLRRWEALNRQLAEDADFDPVLYLDGDEAGDAAQRDALRELPEHSRPLAGWVAGFALAAARFPALAALPDVAVADALARLYRHLPAESDDQRALQERLDGEHPLAGVDDAIADLVLAVAQLWDLTQEERYRVLTVRRDVPKVGRNDPCPCGSGRKYKACHGTG